MLLDGSCDVVCLPTHNGEVVHPGVMISGVEMVIDKERGSEMFLEPFPKVLAGSPMYSSLHSTLSLTTLLCDAMPIIQILPKSI